MLEVRLLGAFEVKRDGKPVAISSRPAQSLFAHLILTAGTVHRREKLAGMLWPDSLEETARDNLRHALWRIRKALPANQKTEYLQADDISIAFNPSSDYRLDASTLDKVGENATADELIAVLSEYQGELLPGFYDEWVVLEREHLSSIFSHHMARLMSLLQDEKRWLDILDWGERWIKLGQKPEPAFRALMSAHAAKGDMSKVAATYERCIRSLKELGVEPSEQTHALYKKLKVGKEILETGSTIPVKEKRKESAKTNLPIPLTSFIGREREIEDVKLLLSSTRLLTLTGSGGMRETYDFLSLPLLVRPNSVLPVGGRTDRPDYDYSEDVTLKIFQFENGRHIRVVIPTLAGNVETIFDVQRDGDIIHIERQGAPKAWKVLLVTYLQSNPTRLWNGPLKEC